MSFRATDDGLSLSELSERTKLVPSTVLRLLASLAHFGLVQRRADGRYLLGATTARLYQVYSASFHMETLVVPALQELMAKTKESASFHVKQGSQRLVLYRVNSPHPLADQTRVGDLLPLDKGSGGHVLMAFDDAPGKVYDEIRRTGYVAAPVSDRSPDLAGISVPVFDARNAVAGSLTLTMPAQRYKATHIAKVRAIAARLTQALGGTPRRA